MLGRASILLTIFLQNGGAAVCLMSSWLWIKIPPPSFYDRCPPFETMLIFASASTRAVPSRRARSGCLETAGGPQSIKGRRPTSRSVGHAEGLARGRRFFNRMADPQRVSRVRRCAIAAGRILPSRGMVGCGQFMRRGGGGDYPFCNGVIHALQ